MGTQGRVHRAGRVPPEALKARERYGSSLVPTCPSSASRISRALSGIGSSGKTSAHTASTSSTEAGPRRRTRKRMSSLPRRRTVDHLAGGRRPRSPGDPVAALPRSRNLQFAGRDKDASTSECSRRIGERHRPILPTAAGLPHNHLPRLPSDFSSDDRLTGGAREALQSSRTLVPSRPYRPLITKVNFRRIAGGAMLDWRMRWAALFAAGWHHAPCFRQAPSQNPRSVPSPYRRRCRPPAAARRAAGARRGTGARSGPAPPSLRRWRPGRYAD
jgi:hypothetical protein